MRGVHAKGATDVRTILRVLREVGLLGLVSVLTWISTQDASTWSVIPTGVTGFAAWAWLPVGGAALFTVLRLRWPMVALLAGAAQFGWWPVSGAALAVAAFEIARLPSAPRRVALLGAAALTSLGVSVLSGQVASLGGFGFRAASTFVCLALPAVVRTLLGKAARVQRALRERAQYLEENYRLARSSARLAERSRIAQEMHDQLGHRLSLIAMYSGALELGQAGKGGTYAAEATLIRGTAQTAMHELRAILGVLRPGGGDGEPSQPSQPAAEAGLRSDITRLVTQSRAAGVEVGLQWRGSDLADVPSPVRSAVHNIVREGLTNVHRHAAGATATILVERGPDAVRVRVANGVVRPRAAAGPALPPGSGLGLVGVRERVTVLGGGFSAGRLPDGGFHITADLPMRAPGAAGYVVGPSGSAGDAALGAAGDAARGAAGDAARGAADGAGIGDQPTVMLRAVGKQALSADRWLRYGSSVVIAGGLVGVAALVLVVLSYTPFEIPETEVRIGMTTEQVLEFIGADDPLARLAARQLESAPPAGSNCLYEQDFSEEQVGVRRYCFRDDRLITIDRIEIEDDADA